MPTIINNWPNKDLGFVGIRFYQKWSILLHLFGSLITSIAKHFSINFKYTIKLERFILKYINKVVRNLNKLLDNYF